MCVKRPITPPFERSEPFHLLRLMGVSVPSLHIESTDSDKLYAAKTVMIAREISSNMKAKARMEWACKNHNIRNPY